MRTSLILGLLFLAIVLLAGPYVTGSQIAAWHARHTGNADEEIRLPGLPRGWRVQDSQLSRGWFASDLHLQVLPPPAFCEQDPCTPMAIDSRIHHGPLALGALPARAAMLPGLAVAVTQLDLNRLLAGQQPEPPLPRARIATRIGLAGTATSQLQMPASSHRLADGANWSHDGLSGQWSDRDNAVTLQVASSEYSSAEGTSLKLADARLEQATGKYDIALDSISLSRAEQPALQLNGLALELRGERTPGDQGQPELAAAQANARLQTLRQGERGIGPMELALNMERLAMDSLQKVRSSVAAIYSQNLPPHLQQLALQGLLLRELPALTRSGPHIELENFQLGLGEQQIQASMDLRLAPQTESQRSLTDFIEAIDLAAEMDVPAQVADLAAVRRAAKKKLTPDEQLEEWQGKGWLISAGDRYRSSLRLADGRLTVNGNESQEWTDWMKRMQAQQAQSEGLAGQRNWQQRLLTPDNEADGEDTP